ncbi:MAG: bifunctional heptose 7-phosphate kinase/heptose 1-phosphate adenyltransferase [Thermomicrobiales bacterium]
MAVRRETLLDALPRLRGQRVAVVGDMLLDEYVFGSVSRVSREAPVLVLEHERDVAQPGGGAFPALAVRAMGGESVMIGCVGADATAAMLVAALDEAGVDTAGIQSVPDRTTTCKTRFLAEGFFRFPQQVARVDRGTRAALPPDVEARIIAALAAIRAANALLVSDYRYGTITPAVTAAVRVAGAAHGAVTAVDSQGSLDPYHGFTLVRDNRADAAAYLREPLDTVASVIAALPRLRERLNATNVVISLGDQGLAYLDATNGSGHIPAHRVDVYDVTGAGDTLIVVLTLALAAGLSLEVGAHLANLAAGVAVRKLGNSVVTAEELHHAILDADDAMFDPDARGE